MSRSAFVYRGSRSIPSKFSERSFSIWCQTYLWTCKPISSHFKGQGYSEKLTIFVFGYSKVAFSFSTHRSFSLWSACCPEGIRLERRDFGGRHSETVLAVIPSDLKWACRRKTFNCRTWHPSQRQQNLFSSDYPLRCLQCYHFRVWSMFGLK